MPRALIRWSSMAASRSPMEWAFIIAAQVGSSARSCTPSCLGDLADGGRFGGSARNIGIMRESVLCQVVRSLNRQTLAANSSTLVDG
jgi:hypothetical protein